MNFNSATFKSIVFVCALIGACQSLIWICLSVCAILTFRCVLRTPNYESDHFIVTTIVKLYFEGEECKVEGYPPEDANIFEAKLTKPIQVFSWMIAFLVMSCIQLLSSLRLLKRRKNECASSVLTEWCFVTFAVTVMDAVLSAIFILDYITLNEYFKDNSVEDKKGISGAAATMFIVAARGFALWIVNVIFIIYFTLYMLSSSYREKTSYGKGGEKLGGGGAHVNKVFLKSTESLFSGSCDTSDLTSATEEIAFYPVNKQKGHGSVSSFEAVTRFNEDEPPEKCVKKKGEPKMERSRYECDCKKWSDEVAGNFQRPWTNNIYHSHGCPALRSELEQKLATIRSPEDRYIYARSKKLTDFSHDIRNFKSGGGHDKKKWQSQIPEAPPIPVALTCSNTSF